MEDSSPSLEQVSSSTEVECQCCYCKAKRAGKLPQTPIPGTPPFEWPNNWVWVIDDYYWQRGEWEVAEFGKFSNHGVCQFISKTTRTAYWEVYQMGTNVLEQKVLFYRYSAMLPEGQNPPDDFW